MPIVAGEDWGRRAPLPSGQPIATSDTELAALVPRDLVAGDRADGPAGPFGLIGGDLCRTLGGHPDAERLFGPAAVTVEIDVGLALVDGRRQLFVAHLVCRNPLWHGRAAVVMNAAWLGDLHLGPRAHPGDGLLDITVGSLPLLERLRARRRARFGDHLPHPRLRASRVSASQLDLGGPVKVFVDGVAAGRSSDIVVRAVESAVTVVVA